MSACDVSVIIPAYNASKTLGHALQALAHQDYVGRVEVIVVDDGSTDQTAALVHSFPSVRYFFQDNAGPASARNHGAAKARGKFLMFTDSDCIPHSDWVTALMAPVPVDVAVVCGSYGIANPTYWLARAVHAEIKFRHERLMPDFPKAFGSYNFCVSKKVFDELNGFDSSYRQASGEDNDLSYKIIKAGYRIFFNKNALVDHFHPTRFWRYLNEQFRHGFWRVKMYAAHPRMVRGDGYTFWKDMVEVPWVGVVVLFMFLSALGVVSLRELGLFLAAGLLIFEICWMACMMHSFFEAICAGFLVYARAFARTFGFSTGILLFFLQKMIKKS